jgi:hypothetical protein
MSYQNTRLNGLVPQIFYLTFQFFYQTLSGGEVHLFQPALQSNMGGLLAGQLHTTNLYFESTSVAVPIC